MIFCASKLARFRERIRASIKIDERGCWIWQKALARNGYGTFSLGGGQGARAHRISYLAYVGPIPDDHDVCHRCDVRSCVNPEHLFVGTRSENILDASRKNRISRTHQKKGSAHPSAKLTEADVIEIRCLLRASIPKTHIASQFGVSDRVILLISRRELWKHVPEAA